MRKFSELNRTKVEWVYDSSKNEWTSLDDWIANGKPTEFDVRGIFINPHGKITKTKTGDVAYIITDGFNIRLPKHMVKVVSQILAEDDLVKAINDGECLFRHRTYEDSDGVTRNSGIFTDRIKS